MDSRKENPFSVQTPESLAASDIVSLFVEEYTDFAKIPNVGHTFLNGARGAGKSMIFRYLEPDCQCLARLKPLHDLPFYAAYVPIKTTDLNLSEFSRLEENKHAHLVLNEHLMTVYVAGKIFASLKRAPISAAESKSHALAMDEFCSSALAKLLARAGWDKGLPKPEHAALSGYISNVIQLFDDLHAEVTAYLRRVAFSEVALPYTGALLGYLDFLVPMVKQLKALPFMPNAPVFLLIDDADNLNRTQTMILNSWVSYRTTEDISLKISTQLRYKTYRTTTGQNIDSPHDYSEVNISDVYTTRKNKYRERVSKIIEKRFAIYGISATPEEFFPPDVEQEQEISELAELLEKNWEKEGKGYRPSDDAARYARPNYITGLKGKSKNAPTYSYSGFDQLVHISSGVVRYFLEPAALMYAEQKASNPGKPVKFISPSVQNKVVREQANNFMFSEFDKMLKDEGDGSASLDKPRKLRNLISALGGAFHLILLSPKAAERRVFSIAFSDSPDDEILGVLDLGVSYGYFHRSSIGNKEGTGRTYLYILSRRLAPYFTLDPTGFAGYKFITSDAVREAMRKPKTFLGRLESSSAEDVFESPQRGLFEG